MRRLVVPGLILAWAIVVCGQGNKSQTKPDLSGTWAFDHSRSNVRKTSTANYDIKITHHDPEFIIVRTITINGKSELKESIYYTDGRGETNPTTIWISTSPNSTSPRPPQTSSKTRWSGERVVIRSTLRMREGIHTFEDDVVDEWKLSADGKTLTQTSRHILPPNTAEQIFVPAHRPDDKRVYSLVSK
jgi:hypothetical protein